MGAVLLAQELKNFTPPGTSDALQIPVVLLHPGFNRTEMTAKFQEIWDIEGAVDPAVGAKRVLYEVARVRQEDTGSFINCEDGLRIPW